MTLNRFNPRRDKNEAEIVRALTQCGRRCLRLDGFDLLVLNPDKSINLLEVKAKNGALTVLQKALLAQGWPLKIVHTVEEALQAVGASLIGF